MYAKWIREITLKEKDKWIKCFSSLRINSRRNISINLNTLRNCKVYWDRQYVRKARRQDRQDSPQRFHFTKWRYPEINSENSWNFTKYPMKFYKMFKSSITIVYDATTCNSWNLFILKVCRRISILENSKNSWSEFLNFGRSGSIDPPQVSILEIHVLIELLMPQEAELKRQSWRPSPRCGPGAGPACRPGLSPGPSWAAVPAGTGGRGLRWDRGHQLGAAAVRHGRLAGCNLGIHLKIPSNSCDIPDNGRSGSTVPPQVSILDFHVLINELVMPQEI